MKRKQNLADKRIKKQHLTAFTLSEVLIALTIIGVVAALTVPALIQRTQKQEYVSALQKAYSTFSQATNQIIAENGSPKGDDSWMTSKRDVYNMFKKYLNNSKDCGYTNSCFANTYKWLNGAVSAEMGGVDTNVGRLALADGMGLEFFEWVWNKNCNGTLANTKDVCAAINVDLNGEKKPNQWGKDVFAFVLKENGLYPAGCDDRNADDCNRNGRGYSCACKVLREGKMDY